MKELIFACLHAKNYLHRSIRIHSKGQMMFDLKHVYKTTKDKKGGSSSP